MVTRDGYGVGAESVTLESCGQERDDSMKGFRDVNIEEENVSKV